MDRHRYCNNKIHSELETFKPKSRLILHTPFIPKSIISYGLIVYAKDTKRTLIIQRKHSAEFLLIICGLYRKSYLPLLLCSITEKESEKILTCYTDYKLFDNLYYYELGLSTKDYNNAILRFRESKELIIKILSQCNLENNKLSWTWPKGRLSNIDYFNKEHPFNCAKREFVEETEIELPEALYISNGYFSELMTTVVGRIVESRYYIYIIPNEIDVEPPKFHPEVSDRKWVDNETCKKFLINSHDIIDKISLY